MHKRRVVVTGLGVVSPLGNDLLTFWDQLSKGASGAAEITKFDATKFKTKFACEVKDFDIGQYLDRKEARKMDVFSHYAIAAASMAIEHSKVDLDKLNKRRCGVIWGSGIGGLSTYQEEVMSFARGEGNPKFSPFFIPRMIVDIAPGHISMRFGFNGINFTTVSACASSGNALGEAYHNILLGKSDLIITGGSESCINESAIGGFNAMMALSVRNDDPKTASRPYDKDRDGFVLGEGGASLIIEELEHALARGATIYGEIVGYGASADAYHITAPHPEGDGVILAMLAALEEGGIKPSDVGYINVHGTSTPLGDVAELKAIEKVFGADTPNIAISSTKSMTGHLLGGAGAIESVACIMAMNHSLIPPTINNFNLDPEIGPHFNLVLNHAIEKEVKYAINNTFGFGGHNVSLAIAKYEA